jgi:NADH:ubiquinone oxidoreductase subunit E
MRREKQNRIALGMTLTSAVVVLVCAGVLIADHAVVLGRAPDDKTRVAELVAGVKNDAAVAEPLHEERDRQTLASIDRKDRNRALAWLLLLAGGGFVAGGKWAMSLRPQRSPSLDDLVSERFASPAPASREPDAEHEDRQDDRIDLKYIDDLVDKFGRGREAAVPILQAIQTHYRYLPDEALQRVCELTEITPAQITGTSTFYAQFRRSPVGRYVVRVCHGTACHVAGAEHITQELRRHLAIAPGEDTDPDRLFTIDSVACLGCCSLAPVMMIEEETAGHLTPASARQALDNLAVST